jgi:hypothetical protein
MSNLKRFKYYIDAGSGDVEIKPTFPEDAGRTFELEQDQQFVRPKLSFSWTLSRRSDYDLIINAAFDQKFTLTIKSLSLTGVETTLVQGEFYRTDLSDWDKDGLKFNFKVDVIDKYLNIISNLETEFNLIDVVPEQTTVKYLKQPLIQVYIPSAGFLTNLLNGVYWETPVTNPISLTSEIENTYKFALGKGITYIAGDDTVLTPDVSGTYDNTTGQRTDGLYQITSISLGGGSFQWVIRDVAAPQTIRYEAPVDEFPFPDAENPFQRSTEFVSVTDPAVKCRASRFLVYVRYLTDLDEVSSVSTFPIPDDDLIGTNFGYQYCIGLATDNFLARSDNQTDPTRWGKFGEDATNFAGQYFPTLTPAPSSGIDNAWPVNPSEWYDFSLWFYYDAALKLLQEDGAKTIENTSCFKLPDVLSALLYEIDPDITHEENVAHSALFYDAVNPITGIKTYPIITQKENVKIGDYDQPAQRVPIRMSNIIELLRERYNSFIYIDADDRLKIEHYKFFNNGGSYSTAQIGIDTTVGSEFKTKYPWDFATSLLNYNKQDIPQEITFKWMDKTTIPFDGYPIKMTSGYVEKGNIDERIAGFFTTDVDFIQVQPGSISDEGFVLFECVMDGSDFVVPIVELIVDATERYNVQNGYASGIFLADKYFRDGLPVKNVVMNRVTAVVADSIVRSLEQEVELPLPDSFDTIKLIRTKEGDGKIKTINERFSSGTAKITLTYEPE